MDFSKNKAKFLFNFIATFDITFVDQFSSILDRIVEILKILEKRSVITLEIFSDVVNSSTNFTPFVDFCRKYAAQRKLTRLSLDGFRLDSKFLYNQVSML